MLMLKVAGELAGTTCSQNRYLERSLLLSTLARKGNLNMYTKALQTQLDSEC
jgi:hypothetical protein